MKTMLRLRYTLLAAGVALVCASAVAAPVTNWHTFKASPATTLAGQGTGSPTFGSTAVTSSAGFLVGYFQALSLTNVGDRINFTYQCSFTDAGGMASAGDNFRYALFDLNGQTPVTADNTATAGVTGQTDNWRGYWFGQKGGGGAGNAGSIRERTNALASGANIFSATAPNTSAPSIGTPAGANILLVSSTGTSGPTYTGTMALEKTPTGVAVAGILGGNGATNIYVATDDAPPTPVNYGAVAWLNGGPLSCDQFNFQNVDVSYVASNALAFVVQPVSTTVNVGQPVTFSAVWTGSGIIPRVQWRENGSDLVGETNSTYTIAAASFGQSGFTYSVVVSNVFGDGIVSTNAVLTVNNDTNPPTVLSVSSIASNILNVVFSEPVDSATAQDSGSYTLAGNSFSAFTMIGTTNVQLTADNLIATNFTLSVQNVKDTSGNTMASTNLFGYALGFQNSQTIATTGAGFAFNDKEYLYASGSDIFGTGDQFQYVYKPVSGDFDLQVKVESLQNTDANAKAGLMARLNTFFDARNVMIEATPARFIFQYRTNSGSGSEALTTPRPPTAFPNCWVRLKRVGSVISGYSATNSGSWTFVGSLDTAASPEGAYPADILIGLAATSHNTSQQTVAVFSGFANAVATSALSIVNNHDGTVTVSWSSGATGLNLQATPSVTAPVTWTNVPNSNLTNQMTLPVGPGASYFRLSN